MALHEIETKKPLAHSKLRGFPNRWKIAPKEQHQFITLNLVQQVKMYGDPGWAVVFVSGSARSVSENSC